MNISDVLLSHFVLNILACIIPDDGGGPSKHVGGTKKLCPMYIAHGKIPLCFFFKMYPQPLPFGQSERPSYTLTQQHNGQIYSSVYFMIYISEGKTGR